MKVRKVIRGFVKTISSIGDDEMFPLLKYATILVFGFLCILWVSYLNSSLAYQMREDSWREAHPELVEKSLEYKLFEQQLPEAIADARRARRAQNWSRFADNINEKQGDIYIFQTLLAETAGKSREEMLEITKRIGHEVNREMSKHGDDYSFRGADLLHERPDLVVRLIMNDQTAKQEINSMFQSHHWGVFFQQLRERKSDDPVVQDVIRRLPEKDASLEEVRRAVYAFGNELRLARRTGEKIDFRLTAFADKPYQAATLATNGVAFAEFSEAYNIMNASCAWGEVCKPTSYRGDSPKYHVTEAYESYYQTTKALNWLYAGLVLLLMLVSPALYRRTKGHYDRKLADRREKLESELAAALEVEAELELQGPGQTRISLDRKALSEACEKGILTPYTSKLALEYFEVCDEEPESLRRFTS